MGWAKYVEDNMEMRTERLYRPLNENRFRVDAYIEVRTVLPVTIFPIEVSIAVTAPKVSCKLDHTLLCRDCGKQFVFSGKEQSFFEMKGFKEPKRCRKCRKLNKAKYEAWGLR